MDFKQFNFDIAVVFCASARSHTSHISLHGNIHPPLPGHLSQQLADQPRHKVRHPTQLLGDPLNHLCLPCVKTRPVDVRSRELLQHHLKKKSQEIKGRFFLRKYDVFFSLPKKYAENYPEKEILKYD